MERRTLLSAYTLNTIGLFGVNDIGASPVAAPIFDTHGNLYGTTSGGGAYGAGTIYEIPSGSSLIKTLASFTGADGGGKASLAIDANGNLFGANPWDIFELPAGSSSIKVLAQFDSSLAPVGPEEPIVLDSSDDLFGVSVSGGAADVGGVFELTHGSSNISLVASFDQNTIGYEVFTLIADSAGNLFGTSRKGGSGGYGTLFEIPHGTATILPVISFNGTNGAGPTGLVFDAAGNLFGLTQGGGPTNRGIVYELPKGGSTITVLASQGGVNTNNLVMDASGNIYDLAGLVDAVIQYPHGTYAPTQVAQVGSGPLGIALDTNGNIFGTTNQGGTSSTGSVFEIPHGSSTVNTVASFGYTNGQYPQEGVAVDGAGNVFGFMGGAFEIPSGTTSVKLIAPYASSAIGGDQGPPVLDGSGNLWANGYNSIFELPRNGSSVISIGSFNGSNGEYPRGSLVIDQSGDVFGTTSLGGANGDGVIFEIVHGTSTITDLASFNGTNGQSPVGLVSDANGNFYGMAAGDSAGNSSIIFELPVGTSTIISLVHLNSPPFPVVASPAGDLYWMPRAGISELPHGSTTPTAVVTMDSTLFLNTKSAPALDASGNIYGMTQTGYGGNAGTIFEVPHGSLSPITLASFQGATGGDPEGYLDVTGSGAIYGTAFYGGPVGQGSVFELSPLPLADVITASGTPITVTAEGDNQHVDWTSGSVGGRVAVNDPSGLTINGDGSDDSITLDYSNGDPLPNTIQLNGTFTINGLSAPSALAGTTLDLSQGSTAYVSYPTGSDPLTSIKVDLQAGYSAGAWTGVPTSTTGVITSAAAAASPTQLAVGYTDSADPNSPDTIPNTIELKTTFLGDTNLDGSVNLSDLLTLTRNFGKGSNWVQGDFNYDSSVNLSDFLALTRNFGKTLVVNPLIVTSTADDGSLGTLRYAITHSNAGDTITFDPTVFAPGTTHTLTLNGSQLELTHNLTIQGPGSANLSISGNNASRIFQIDPSVTASISGLTLTAGDAAAAYGGAINNSGTLNLTSCSITSSTATDGGGLYSISGAANVTNCTFSNDTASAYGGALFNDTGATSTATGCTFTNNSAGHGGALLDYGTALILINDTITQNSSTGSGGGINNVAGKLIVSNCTIVNNTTGSSGGGIYNGQTATINNSIVAENTTTSSSPTDLAGNSFSGSNNLIGDGSGGLSTSNHNLLGSTASLLNPKLGSLANNGGPTLTFMPLSGSPVIDAGSNTLIPSGISTDQRGYARIFNGTVDIGAVEFGASLAPALTSATQQQSASVRVRRRV